MLLYDCETGQSSESAEIHREPSRGGPLSFRLERSSGERVLPSASNLWVQSSLNQKERLQQLFFPDGVRFDGKRIVGTGTTLPVFNYLSSVSEQKKELVDQTGIEPVTS
jgi:hypothetical protein